MKVTGTLIKWYELNKRDLPWRNTKDPYKIWLSEIILQQTRVDQGMPYYFAFVEKYPDICALANASEDEVLRTWQGLGYYSRARNLHHTSMVVCNEYGGKFPSTYEQILRLKGIGPYTAAAVSSFAFGEAKPVVDGNVFRFLSRLFAIETPINDGNARALFEAHASAMMEGADPAIFNQALMEFGALQCVPSNPDCGSCVMRADCRAFEMNLVNVLPVKTKKQKVKTVYFNFLHMETDGNTFIEKRTGNGIWKNMYQFPLVESENDWVEDDLVAYMSTETGLQEGDWSFNGVYRTTHLLSHRKIQAGVWKIRLENGKRLNKIDIFEIPVNSIDNYAIPRLLEKYLEEKED